METGDGSLSPPCLPSLLAQGKAADKQAHTSEGGADGRIGDLCEGMLHIFDPRGSRGEHCRVRIEAGVTSESAAERMAAMVRMRLASTAAARGIMMGMTIVEIPQVELVAKVRTDTTRKMIMG